MFENLIENNLLSHNQSGFKPGDLCINPNLGGLFRGSFCSGEGECKITPLPYLKLIKIMLKT